MLNVGSAVDVLVSEVLILVTSLSELKRKRLAGDVG